MIAVSFKLIFRSWWRNKMFAIISILSLAVGIACVNMLIAFVIYEYNVESGNPNKKYIYYMSQDSPMESGEFVSYIVGNVPPLIKDNYPEVEDYLRLTTLDIDDIRVDEHHFQSIVFLSVDSSFMKFFPYKVLYGDVTRALKEPNKVALLEHTAHNLFGKENPLGKYIYTKSIYNKGDVFYSGEKTNEKMYEVVAVLKDKEQSFLKFDILTSHALPFHGGPSLLMTNTPIDSDSFAEQLKKDKIPTMQMENGRYYFAPLQESYFHEYRSESLSYINRQQKPLLYVGLFSAFLILLIACFNYINLNFSRLLQQVRMIHIQKLMGAKGRDIKTQLFLDTFCTVFIAFLFSLLITHDLLPVFNSIVGGRMHTSFFFNGQVLPMLCGFVILLSIIPAFYIGRKISKLSHQGYKAFFSGRQKNQIITALSIAQFAISIGLIIATLTVNSQINLIKKGGQSYKGLIEIGGWEEDNRSFNSFIQDLRTRPEIGTITATKGSLLYSGLMQIVINDEQGGETFYPLMLFEGDTEIFETFGFRILQGFNPDEAIKKFAKPVYINGSFAAILVKDGENPIGKPLKSYYNDFDYQNREDGSKEKPYTLIAGVVENFYTNTLEREVFPATIMFGDKYYYAYIRINPKQPHMLATVKSVWEKHNPGKTFAYSHVWDDFKMRNQKAIKMSSLLIMYSLISIVLTCFGLFGIALYATEQRLKEIGIKKVNGATTLQIMTQLNLRFITGIGVAFLFAVPVSWLMLSRWLENFVYRVNVSIWICLLSGVIVLAITLLTVSWHSYKAASRNPVNALKSE